MFNEILRCSQISALGGIKKNTVHARIKSIFPSTELTRSTNNHILLSPEQVRLVLADRLYLNSKVGKIIYIGNLKGGVGKTALAYLLTNAASILGIKTCALDLDVQANLTNQYTEIEVKQPVMVDVIANKKKIQNVIIPLSPNLDLVPS